VVLRVGTVVAGYRIQGVLGSGGMGTVYRAAHPALPRSDALKILSSEYSQDAEFRARFVREADLAATLDHPNIVTVYNRGETDEGQLWIAMQYVAGSDADKELIRGRMTPNRAVHIITELAKALDYAHGRNLLHRDVKPANFLLASQDVRVLLADFGIARALDDSSGLTATGMVVASVAYAAPETLSGKKVDGRADIYSLGCSLYRMLTGRTPFADAGGMAGMAAAHLSQPAPRVTDHVESLPEVINAVIAKAMAKAPGDRYQTAHELAYAAGEALAETQIAPAQAPPRGTPVTTPSVRGHRPSVQHSLSAPRLEVTTYPSAHYVAHTLGSPAFADAVTPAGVPQHYQPQSFGHVHGTTDIKSAPRAVAALGPGDGAAVLALGAQPVAIGASDGQLPSWVRKAVTGAPKVLGFPDTAVLAATRPDVIIATGEIDDATYTELSAIAPTVTRPKDAAAAVWTWQNQLLWIGEIVGQQSKARDLVDSARLQQDELRNQHPAFAAKTIEAVYFSDTGTAAALSGSNISDYLQGLGFCYNQDLQRGPGDSRPLRPIKPDSLYLINTDALVVIYTDTFAGSVGFNGLPVQLTGYRGVIVIVDDPNVIAALADPGGYLGTEYLNSTFLDVLAQHIK
jgi:eukaryotic-like serine/threonine-protein kinase